MSVIFEISVLFDVCAYLTVYMTVSQLVSDLFPAWLAWLTVGISMEYGEMLGQPAKEGKEETSAQNELQPTTEEGTQTLIYSLVLSQ